MAIAFREPPLRQWRARTVSRVLQTLHGGPRRTPARNYRVAGAAVTGEAAAVPSVSARRALLGVLVAAFVAGTAWAYSTGRVSPGSIDAWLGSLGPAAPALFVGAFALGAMVGLPGVVFVVGGRLAFGAELGLGLGYGGGLLACITPFAAARRLRGGAVAAWQPRNRHLRRAFDMVESHPLRAVILLRLMMWFSPPLSYALAVTGVPARTYVAGCAIALVPVVAIAVLATGWIA